VYAGGPPAPGDGPVTPIPPRRRLLTARVIGAGAAGQSGPPNPPNPRSRSRIRWTRWYTVIGFMPSARAISAGPRSCTNRRSNTRPSTSSVSPARSRSISSGSGGRSPGPAGPATTGGPEPVAFNLTAQVADGQSTGVVNYLIFDGLTVGENGVAFEGTTVNVSNAGDQAILNGLKSQAFEDGLKLLTTAQPAIKPFTELGLAVAKAVASRNQNRRVQYFKVGLDFGRLAGGVRLREGVYVIAQVPATSTGWPGLTWSEWVYLTDRRTIARKSDHFFELPVNFVSIGVNRYPSSPCPNPTEVQS
jgi:hypothetical protein